MTEQQQERQTPRRRRRIYPERRIVSLRLSIPLHEALSEYVDERRIPINTYVVKLIEADLARQNRLSRAKVTR